MKILYLYAHPNVNSFNQHLKEFALEKLHQLGHKVMVSDLYAQKFNPTASWDDFECASNPSTTNYMNAQKEAFEKNHLREDIKTEIEKIIWADHLIFQFPLWWFSMPAILKGWFDRVLAKGFAYDAGYMLETGLLKNKTASCIVTTHFPKLMYQESGLQQHALDDFLMPIHHSLKFVGMDIKPTFAIHSASHIDQAFHEASLQRLTQYLEELERACMLKVIK